MKGHDHAGSQPPPVHRLAELAPLVLRLLVGLVFVVHGWQKLTAGPSGFAGMLTGLGVGAPELTAWLVTIAELVGGALLLIGAIVLVKADLGIIAAEGTMMPGAELDIALLAGLTTLLLLGPGRICVDHAVGIEPGCAREGDRTTVSH